MRFVEQVLGPYKNDFMNCPECDADIYFDSEKCPRCGLWIEEKYKGRRAQIVRRAKSDGVRRFVKYSAWFIVITIGLMSASVLVLLVTEIVK